PPAPSANDLLNRAAELRQQALRHCDENRFDECVRMLDEAQVLDPLGDADSSIVTARKRATERLVPPIPAPSTSTPMRKGPVTRTPSSISTSSRSFSTPSSGP
ncbi:MAG TPA: hypothetical protein PK156_34855, partial [Polyangium sp.]|nr:hypothetical protein [Polyangium sp.]